MSIEFLDMNFSVTLMYMIQDYYMNYKNTPCRKLIEWLLIDHRKTAWKVNQKIPYKQFLPYSKKFIKTWIDDNLFGPTKLMLLKTLQNISCPETIESRYKKFHPDIWTILADPSVRVQMELDSLFGYSISDMHNRLNERIKPRIIDVQAIKQFLYFFWNLQDDEGVFRPTNLLELIGSNRKIYRAYAHIHKYYNDKNGKYKYEVYYHLDNPEEPDIKNVSKIINLSTTHQIEAFENNEIEKVEALSHILELNAGVYKTLKTIPDKISKEDLASFLSVKED